MSRRPDPRSAGSLIAVTVMAGALIGTIQGQPTIGTLIGFAIGLAGALAVWLIDRRA